MDDRARHLLLAAAIAALLGCGGEAPATIDAGRPAAAPTRAGEVAPPPRTRAPAPEAPSSARVAIPAGTVLAGSLPGTPGRRPSREADEIPVEVAAFEIDRLPYPNDPLASPRLVAGRAEAAALCAARQARLCSELEWERACEGDANERDPGASALGVLQLGLAAPEWTTGEVPEASVRMGRTAVQRGARADAPADLHRCASRTFELPEGAPPAAFRCCHSAEPPAAYPDVEMYREVRDLPPDAAAIRAALRAAPETAPYADGFSPYGIEDGDRALARGGVDRAALAGWELAPGPFAWSPSPGELAWVIAGASGDATLIAVLYPLEGGRFVHAASFVLEGEPDAPLAISRTPASRGELRWTACAGCPGESGVITFGDDAVIRVIQR